MTLTKMQAMLGVATGILVFGGIVAGDSVILERRFAALDTRLGKLESAIRTMNVTTPDERYKQLIKELMAIIYLPNQVCGCMIPMFGGM